MKTRYEERMDDIKVSEVLRAFPITLVGLYIASMLYPIFGVFYALGGGIAVLTIVLWLSHLYYKLETRNIKKSVRDKGIS